MPTPPTTQIDPIHIFYPNGGNSAAQMYVWQSNQPVLWDGAVTGTLSIAAVVSTTGTSSTIADSTTSTTLLASNSNRKGAAIENDSSAALYVKCGTTASSTSYTVRMVQYAYYEVPFSYTGIITGIWATDPGDGAARITEFT